MTYRICKSFEIESGHMLSNHPDRCRFPHGHTRSVEIVMEADELDQHQMVCDFKGLKAALSEFIDSFDHALCINTDDPLFETFRENYGDRIIAFEHTDPTSEVMAQTLYTACKERLAAYSQQTDIRYPLRTDVRLKRIRVWETSTSWAEYDES